MKITTIISTFLILTFVLYTSKANENSFSLEEAQNFAIENSIQQKNAALDFKITQKQSLEVISEGFPQINAEASYQNFLKLPVSLIPLEFIGGPEGEFQEIQFGLPHNVNANITVSQLIFDFRYFVGIRANKALMESAKTQLYQNEIDLKKAIEESYYAALASLETVEILENNLEIINKTLHETEQLLKSGFAEQLDVDRLKLSQSNVNTQFKNAERQAKLALAVLKYQMGYPVQDEIILTENLSDLIENSLLTDMEYDYQNRIEFRLLNLQRDLRTFDISQTRAGYFPSLYAFGTYNYDAQRNEFNFFDSNETWFESGFVGLQLRIPIFDGLTRRFMVQQRQLDLMKINNQIQNFDELVRLEVQNARTELENAFENYQTQLKNLELAERIYNVTVRKYQEGVGSSLEVSNAESDWSQTQANYIQSMYQVIISRTQLKHSMGLYNTNNN
ncbi:MAG: TolC family protein [Chitinophagaceae bacterium]|nr:MAG: TolC family protein [Chitinophagaceae bacterium]